MRGQKYNKGEISLGYLLKLGGAACLTMTINTCFDAVTGMLETYRVQSLTTSGPVVTAKRCVFETMMSGSYSQLPRCSSHGSTESSAPEVTVDHEGVVSIKTSVQDKPVSLRLTPSFRPNGSMAWGCRGKPEEYMPQSCSGDVL